MESSFTIARVKGIPIGAHWSWILVFALVVWSLTSTLFPQTVPTLSDGTYIWMGVVTAVLFFASILLHELGHAFAALREGMEIDGITLWLFGGVARFRGMFPSAGAEFRIAAAGPVVSVVLGAVFYGLDFLGAAVDAPQPFLAIVSYLARINALVVAFNLVPALPLDGGRILRSWLWHRQRSFPAATRSAARAGKVFGGVLAIVGLLNFFAGGAAAALWLVFLGWFLIQAAQAEGAMVLVTQALGDRRIRDLMTPDPETVTPDMTVQDFLDQRVTYRGHSTYPVVRDGVPVGLMSARLASAVEADRRATASIADVMLPIDQVPTVAPDDKMIDILDDLQEGPRRAIVRENGDLKGILSVSDVARAIEVQQARGEEQKPRRAGIFVWIVVGLLIALAGGFLYHPPVVVLEPGVSFDVGDEIEISGIQHEPINGAYLLTSVSLTRPNGIGVIGALLTGADEIVPVDAVLPEGVDPERFARRQQEIFDQSRMIAAAAAAQAVGLDVSISGTGAIVRQVVPDSPAAGVLRAGDVIVRIDGRDVEVAEDVQRIIRSEPAGSRFELTILRDGERRQVTLQSTELPQMVEPAPVIGVLIGTRDFDISLPFKIDFPDRNIGGPSAGLAYALAIADMLSERDFAQGREIGATGSIGPAGEVGPVGGVPLKAVAVAQEGATLFIVPQSQAREVIEGLEIHGVTQLQEAIEVLQRTASS